MLAICNNGPNFVLRKFPLIWALNHLRAFLIPCKAAAGGRRRAAGATGSYEREESMGFCSCVPPHESVSPFKWRDLIAPGESFGARGQGRSHPAPPPSSSSPACGCSLFCRGQENRSEAYLHLDFLPVLLCDLMTMLFVQLLKDAAIYCQAEVDFWEELIYVGVVGAQDAMADFCELSDRGVGLRSQRTRVGSFLKEGLVLPSLQKSSGGSTVTAVSSEARPGQAALS